MACPQQISPSNRLGLFVAETEGFEPKPTEYHKTLIINYLFAQPRTTQSCWCLKVHTFRFFNEDKQFKIVTA